MTDQKTWPMSTDDIDRDAVRDAQKTDLSQTRLRLRMSVQPLTYLHALNGHCLDPQCTTGDLARAAVYTCCYFQILMSPQFQPPAEFVEECRGYAEWLFEPETFRTFKNASDNRRGELVPVIGIEHPRIKEFEATLLAELDAESAERTRVQVWTPRGLWRRVCRAYGFKYGHTDASFTRVLAGLLYQLEHLEARERSNGVTSNE
jgi:hypothetical protein